MNCSNFEIVDLSRATNEQLAMVNAMFVGNVPEVWRDMAEMNFVMLRFSREFDALSDKTLAQTAINLVYQLISIYGGVQVYLPKGIKVDSFSRNEQIIKEFTGDNTRYLAIKHHLSEMRIRQLIKASKAKANPLMVTTKS